MKKVKFVYNPLSGESGIADRLDQIVELYQKHHFSIVPYRLTFDGNPFDIVYDLDESYHHMLIAGGDGTVNFIVNLLKRNNIDIPIAILPTGTANDFASLIGMPSDPVKACEKILEGDIRPVDLGKVNGEYYVNVFSCGLFTDISQKTPTIMKNTFGKLAYYMGGIGELSRFRKMNIKLESDCGDFEGKVIIFFVFNGRTAGKLNIAYLSEIDDGKLDVLIVKGDGPLETIQTLTHYLLSGKGKQKDYPAGIVHIQCSKLRASCETNESTDIDGQPGPDFPLEITCEQGAMKIIFPKPKVKKNRRKAKPKVVQEV